MALREVALFRRNEHVVKQVCRNHELLGLLPHAAHALGHDVLLDRRDHVVGHAQLRGQTVLVHLAVPVYVERQASKFSSEAPKVERNDLRHRLWFFAHVLHLLLRAPGPGESFNDDVQLLPAAGLVHRALRKTRLVF